MLTPAQLAALAWLPPDGSDRQWLATRAAGMPSRRTLESLVAKDRAAHGAGANTFHLVLREDPWQPRPKRPRTNWRKLQLELFPR